VFISYAPPPILVKCIPGEPATRDGCKTEAAGDGCEPAAASDGCEPAVTDDGRKPTGTRNVGQPPTADEGCESTETGYRCDWRVSQKCIGP